MEGTLPRKATYEHNGAVFKTNHVDRDKLRRFVEKRGNFGGKFVKMNGKFRNMHSLWELRMYSWENKENLRIIHGNSIILGNPFEENQNYSWIPWNWRKTVNMGQKQRRKSKKTSNNNCKNSNKE